MNISIREIKPAINIDTSFDLYFLVGLSIIVVLFVLIAIYLIYKYFSKNREDISSVYIKKIVKLDINEAKLTSYLITDYVRHIDLNEQQTSLYEVLKSDLQQYKYKKDTIKSFDDKTTKHYKEFLESLNE
jgi:hypothetical protein